MIEILDEIDNYPSLLGIDLEFDKNVVINLKQRKISFEIDTLGVVYPLNTREGDRYIEPVRDGLERKDIDIIYNITREKRTMQIQQYMEILVGDVFVQLPHIQKKHWKYGRIDYMKYLVGDV